jgi:hypothetical protein
MPLSLAEELDEIVQAQNSEPQFNYSSYEVNGTTGDLIESAFNTQPRMSIEDVNDAATLSLLQHARVVQSERANITIREALNNHGATLSACAQVLSGIIQNPHIKPDVRRRAVIDVLTLHNANPLPLRQQPDMPQLAISIQTSDKVNLATILNPNGRHRPMQSVLDKLGVED